MNQNNETMVTNPAPDMGVAQPAPAKKGGIVGILIAVVIIAVLAVGGFFLAKTLLFTPKKVFEKTIEAGYKEVEAGLEEFDKIDDIFNFEDHAIVLNAKVKGSTNISYLVSEFDLDKMDLAFEGSVGLDFKNELVQAEGKIKGSSQEIDAGLFIQENAAFLKTGLYDKVIKIAEDIEDEFSFDEIKDELKSNNDIKVDAKVYQKIVKAYKDALIEALDSDAMSKESGEYDVLGKKVKGTKYTYTIDSKAAQHLAKEVSSKLASDKDFVKAVAESTGLKEDEIKEALEDAKKEASDIKVEEKVKIVVYTTGLTGKLSAIEINAGKNETFGYYTNGDDYEIDIEDGSDKVTITAEKSGKEHKLEVKYNKEKVATGTIRELSRNTIDMDIEIKNVDAKFSIYINEKNENNKASGEFKFKVSFNGEEASLEGSFSLEAKDSLDKLKTSDAVDPEAVDGEKLSKNLEEKITKDDTLNAIYKIAMESYNDYDYYDDNDDYDYDYDYDYGDDWDDDDFDY